MAYPQNVTWNQEAFALLEEMLKEGKPFTSLDFKTRLRSSAKAAVYQRDVSAFLQQAYEDGHMESANMEDNGNFRTYHPAQPKTLWQKVRGFFGAVSQD